MPTDLFLNSAMETALDSHLAKSYVDPSDTNFKTALTAESELKGLNKLIDRYLEEKPYLQ